MGNTITLFPWNYNIYIMFNYYFQTEPWNTLLLWYWFLFSTFATQRLCKEVGFTLKPLPLEKRHISTVKHSDITVTPSKSQSLCWWAIEKSSLDIVLQTMMPWPFGDSHPVIWYSKWLQKLESSFISKNLLMVPWRLLRKINSPSEWDKGCSCTYFSNKMPWCQIQKKLEKN